MVRACGRHPQSKSIRHRRRRAVRRYNDKPGRHDHAHDLYRQLELLRAAYEYGAFGEIVRASGDKAEQNTFRFSTKYTDNETQFVYYGFGHYDPKLGRFIGRDPISEKGGLNLYGFGGNNGVNAWDVLGMFSYIGQRSGYSGICGCRLMFSVYEDMVTGEQLWEDPLDNEFMTTSSEQAESFLQSELQREREFQEASDAFRGESLEYFRSVEEAEERAASNKGATPEEAAQNEAAARGLAPGTKVTVPITQNGIVVGSYTTTVKGPDSAGGSAQSDPPAQSATNGLLSWSDFQGTAPKGKTPYDAHYVYNVYSEITKMQVKGSGKNWFATLTGYEAGARMNKAESWVRPEVLAKGGDSALYLLKHETVHDRITTKGGQGLFDYLSGLSATGTSIEGARDALIQKFNESVDHWTQSIKSQNTFYDLMTGHGTNQRAQESFNKQWGF